MSGKIMIGSLALSLLLFIFYITTGNETVLAPILLGLLASFTCAMMQLTKK